MIVARDLSRRFGKVIAVDSINFRIAAGRVVGLLGPNGAGKTTTIRMLTGFLPPTAGSVDLNGMSVSANPRAVRRQLGYLPENAPVYAEMPVTSYLKFRAGLYRVPRARRSAAIDRVIEECSLAEVKRRPVGQLSKGYRQRVGLAAALLHEPAVLVLDEPTSGLDPAQIREVRGLIRRLAGRHTILLSTHILPEAELTCDEIIMMARGRVQAQGTIDELRETAARERARYVVETDLADAGTKIRALAAVERGEETCTEGGWRRLVVTPKPGADDLRELLARTVIRAGGALRELRRESPTLEQLFVQLVAGGQRADPLARYQRSSGAEDAA
jgi:ABC-2 type transport system ATP-binding protein